MEWNRENTQGCPCKGCPARYPACHDKCEKFAEWRKKIDAKRNARRLARESADILSTAKKKQMWKKQRYGNHTMRRRSNDL